MHGIGVLEYGAMSYGVGCVTTHPDFRRLEREDMGNIGRVKKMC